MTSDISIKREALKKAFKNPRSVDKMPDSQVIAIFLRLRSQGKL